MPKQSTKPSTALQQGIQDESVRIAHILNHPQIPAHVASAIENIISDASNESGTGIDYASPAALAHILTPLDERYSCGIVHAIDSLVRDSCPHDVSESASKATREAATARSLTNILSNPKLSRDTRKLISEAICELGNAAGVNLDHPAMVASAYMVSLSLLPKLKGKALKDAREFIAVLEGIARDGGAR